MIAWQRGARKTVTVLLLSALILNGGCSRREYDGVAIENFDEVSRAVENALKNRTYRINVTFKSDIDRPDEEQIADMASRLYEAAISGAGDPRGGDYLKYQIGGYEVRYKKEDGLFSHKHTIRLLPDYYTTAEEESYVDAEVEEIVQNIKSNAVLHASDMSDETWEREIVRLVHDEICDRVSYDRVHGSGNYGHIGATAYAALYYHTATCQGYAVLMYRILSELGIENHIVTGDYTDSRGESEHHAWNEVLVGGMQLFVDVTLDDEYGDHRYLLVTEKELSKDHKRDDGGSDEAVAVHN